MGGAADMMNEGILCMSCGVFIDDKEEGYSGACDCPRYCRGCGGKPELNGQRPLGAARQERKKGKR